MTSGFSSPRTRRSTASPAPEAPRATTASDPATPRTRTRSDRTSTTREPATRRSSPTPPRYRRQRRKDGDDLAFVEVRGRRHYLGTHGSDRSHEAYRRLIEAWASGGLEPTPGPDAELTVTELCARFWSHAEVYYRRPDGVRTNELSKYRSLLGVLRDAFGSMPAASFGPRALKAIREWFIEKRRCRKSINQDVGRLKRVFKFAVAEELIPPSVYQALQAVEGLRRGRSEARESKPVRPVTSEHVDAILPLVSRPVRALVELQLATAARSGELLVMRPCDVDCSGRIWIYSPVEHKTAHRDHDRSIYIGPRGQTILRPFLVRPESAFCFSPAEAESERFAERHAKRVTPIHHGNRPGSNREPRPSLQPGERYTVTSYARAIARACEKAGIPKWTPHRLRHSAATTIRKEFGLEAARVILGHRSPVVTEIYAELDNERALEVMDRIG